MYSMLDTLHPSSSHTCISIQSNNNNNNNNSASAQQVNSVGAGGRAGGGGGWHRNALYMEHAA